MKYEKEIQRTLRQLGANNSYLGFHYVATATELVIDDEGRLLLISKWLYADVAKMHSTSVSCVERDIRTLIKVIWTHGDKEYLAKVCNKNLKVKPKNGEFLSMLSAYIKATAEV